jgi:Ca-activated chloride channel family protein
MSRYSFEYPFVFLLIFLFWFCFKKCPARNIAIYFPYIYILFKGKKVKSRWLDILKWIAIVLLLIALASPVKITKIDNIKQEGRDIMLIIDSSKSMLDKGFDIKDVKKDKFSAVLEVVDNFIKNRKSDRVGLINFASSAFIAAPLTYDKNYISSILKRQKVGIVGKRTAIYDALIQALYIMQNSDTKNKAIILLTDGMDNMSENSFDETLDVAMKSKIKTYIIGVGNKRELDIEKLKHLAFVSGGKFYLATNKDTLSKIYKEIDKLETKKIKAQSYTVYKYYYYFPLMFSIIFLMIYVYLKSVRGIVK